MNPKLLAYVDPDHHWLDTKLNHRREELRYHPVGTLASLPDDDEWGDHGSGCPLHRHGASRPNSESRTGGRPWWEGCGESLILV
jgi:hypothetical protein